MKECNFKPKVIGFKYDNLGLPRNNQNNYDNQERSNSNYS